MLAQASRDKEALRHFLTAGGESGVARHAAVNEDRHAIDVIGHVRGEEHRHVGDVLRLADPFVGDSFIRSA